MDIDLTMEEAFELNVVKFIENVEQHPAVWDRTYNNTCPNKILLEERAEAWKLICRKYDGDFDNKSTREQNKIEKFLKSKWRNLRDCYMRELRDIAKHNQNDHEYKKRKKTYIYFKNMRFIGDLTVDEKTKVKSAEADGEDFSYVDDALVEHYTNEEDILQTLINEGDPENEGEHIVIEQISSLPRQRKRQYASEGYEPQNFVEENTAIKRRIVPKRFIRNHSQFDESSDEQTEHFLDMDAYSSTRPPNIEKVARELPGNRRRDANCELDEDRLFMLSMVPDMKLVPKHIKLDMKADILNVVRNYVKKAHSDETNSEK